MERHTALLGGEAALGGIGHAAMRAWAPAGAGDRYLESVTVIVNSFGTGAEEFLLFKGFLLEKGCKKPNKKIRAQM